MDDINTLFLKRSGNGQFIETDQVPLNRGFLFGDGLFETMIYARGIIRFKDEHVSRIKKGCQILMIEPTEDLAINDLELYLQQEYDAEGPFRIRWNLSRYGLGKYTPGSRDAEEIFMVQKYIYNPPLSKKAYINQQLRVPALPWSNCKTLNALIYVMANLERKNKKFEEVILLNSHGYVCEAGAANLFWIKNDVYYTPSLGSNCIAGIGRKKIIEALNEHRIELVQGEFNQKEILSADQIFTSNVTGINYISQIDQYEFDTGPIPYLESIFH